MKYHFFSFLMKFDDTNMETEIKGMVLCYTVNANVSSSSHVEEQYVTVHIHHGTCWAWGLESLWLSAQTSNFSAEMLVIPKTSNSLNVQI